MHAEANLGAHRHLPLDGTYNVRDLGGYRTNDGRETRWRRFFRADSLHRLTVAAQNTLLDHGLRSVIDLRRSDEVAAAPNVFTGSDRVTYHHLSLLADIRPTPGTPKPLVETYRLILDERQEQVGAALRFLATPDRVPAVIHCTAGKDRTGLIVALVLGLAGVPEGTILEDYALTAQYLRGPFLDEIRQRALSRGYSWSQYEPLVQCPPAFMHTTLHYVRKRYGGIEPYVRSIGLQADEIEALRHALVA